MFLFQEIELKLRDCWIGRTLRPKLLESFPSSVRLQLNTVPHMALNKSYESRKSNALANVT